ncbi:hypothetical protein [Riemerella anatipestifer]|uniref:Uncharacterized protein n=1 Tax=Riemerella anatipestifer TaxID=34085 RepID=A0A1S7DU52_RIEAN|nr:hypothetical protein [Riemerella anatipestifer]AQY22588.1 hypothetical protein AB406_1644 [Riemerella anatipestifer]MCO4304252.1 hypothetical protein [Riemerella anatipestifer]MCO7353022.1 hypothetical protein [Riemerella anatipestifer]MCQ4039546.1 hypothetical protein [Riemerella anatipestifer]MCT6761231.1 hypothetical protein [Riemerella anatipestifer]
MKDIYDQDDKAFSEIYILHGISVWVDMSDLLYRIITVMVAIIFVLWTLLNPK